MPTPSTRQFAIGALAVSAVLASCGSSENDLGATEFTNQAPATTVAIAQPTTSVTSARPTSTSSSQVETTEAEQQIHVASTPEFCDASARYWVASASSAFIDTDSPDQVEAVFEMMDLRLQAALAAAPNDQLAGPPMVTERHLSPVHRALADLGYNWDAFQNSELYDKLLPDMRGLADIEEQLEGYLTDECGMSLEELAAEAKTLGTELALGAGSVASTEVRFVEVVDPAERLKVEVPVHWADTQGAPFGETSELIISPDTEQFLSSWSIDGLRLTVDDAATTVDWRSPMANTAAAEECVAVDSRPYDDGVYIGWIDSYQSCGAGSTAFVIGATNAARSIQVLIEIQFDTMDTAHDAEILEAVLQSFQAR